MSWNEISMNSLFLNNLNNVLVLQLMVFAHSLGIMLGRGAPNLSTLEFLDQSFMELTTEVNYCGSSARHDNWLVVVRYLTLGLCVNSDQIQVIPDFLHQLIEIPLILGRNWHIVRHS